MRVSYFINQYPKVSHSFIRREIFALERQGFQVQRIALRGLKDKLVDHDDLSERAKTQYVLDGNHFGLLLATLITLLSKPLKFMSALGLALKMGLRAERPILYHLIYLAEACQIAIWVKSYKSQHIHAHFGSNSAEIAMLANSLAGPSYSFTVHGPEEFDKPQTIKLAEKAKNSAFVIAVSSYGRSQLYRWLDSDCWTKVKVIRCGLEESFYEVNNESSPSVDRLCILCIGRLCEQKGQLLLIEACQKLKKKGLDFDLVLAGDGEMRDEVERKVKSCQLEDNVRITGWISASQVKAELQMSHVMVLPSFAEGLPVVIMEAMALKKPVISTFIAGIPELIVNGENGWLVPAGSVDALSDAIEQFVNMPKHKLKVLVDNAYYAVKVKHHIDTEACKLAQLFRESVQ